MKDWWEGLQSRERYMVLIATVLVFLTTVYLTIWSPIVSSLDTKQNNIETKLKTVAWMSEKKQEVENLKRINPNLFNRTSDNRSLLAIVDTGAKKMGIRSSITRIEPKGDDSVQVWIENIAFDYLIALLGELERKNNIEVVNASLNRSDQAGKVTGKISLNR